MPSTRELRRRIRSVKSSRQITKAMELVSSAKMRRASQATIAARPYAEQVAQVAADIAARISGEITHPLLAKRVVQKRTLVIIAADRGLAGTFTSGLLKQALPFLRSNPGEVHLVTMGRKLELGLLRQGYTVDESYPLPAKNPNPREIEAMAANLLERFSNAETDEVTLLYTRFRSLMIQEATLQTLLPFEAPTTQQNPFLFEPSAEVVLETVIPRLIEAQLYQAVLESAASEHAARRMAMKNATDNASDVIDDLTLTYNSIRQSSITQELAEITGGSAAQTT